MLRPGRRPMDPHFRCAIAGLAKKLVVTRPAAVLSKAYRRGLDPFLQKLVEEGCDTTSKLLAELRRCRHPRVNRKPWTKSALRTYLLRYQPAFYEAIKSRGERRRWWVEAAIGEIRAIGDYTSGAIAQELEMRGVPMMSGRAGVAWNEELVRVFLLPGRTARAPRT